MGQPGESNVSSLYTEFIGIEELTRGTEISNYPEENKTIVISPVATSEQEKA